MRSFDVIRRVPEGLWDTINGVAIERDVGRTEMTEKITNLKGLDRLTQHIRD